MEVNVNRLIGLKIPVEGFMIMHLLYNEEKELLLSYTKNVKQIPTQVFLDLISQGYLTNTSEDNNFTIDNIELTDKYKFGVLKVPDVKGLDFEAAFNQVREYYPTKVGDPTGGVRRLQSDIDRCKKLYKTAVIVNGEVDEEIHGFILQCIRFEVEERKKGRNLQYMQMLPTYLSKKSWELVADDVRAVLKKNGTVLSTNESDNVENKTMLGSEEF